MNVQELRAALEGLPGELPVVLSSDEEGNSYRYADVACSRWMVTLAGIESVSPDDVGVYWKEDEIEPCVIIW